MADEGGAIFDESHRGATVKTSYAEREVKAFAVFDHEVDALTSLSAQATIFFSVGSAFLSYAVGIWTNAGFVDRLTPVGVLASSYLAPALAVGAVVFFALGLGAAWKRRKTLGVIRDESKSGTR